MLQPFVLERWLRAFAADSLCREFFRAANLRQSETFFARSRLPVAAWMQGLGLYANDPQLPAKQVMERFTILDIRTARNMLDVLARCRIKDSHHYYGERYGFTFRLREGGEEFDYVLGKPRYKSSWRGRGIYRTVPFGWKGSRLKLVYELG